MLVWVSPMQYWGKGLDVLSNLGKSLIFLYQLKCSHYIVVLPHKLFFFLLLESFDSNHQPSTLVHSHHDVIPIISHYPSSNLYYHPDCEFFGHWFSNIILLRVSISYDHFLYHSLLSKFKYGLSYSTIIIYPVCQYCHPCVHFLPILPPPRI